MPTVEEQLFSLADEAMAQLGTQRPALVRQKERARLRLAVVSLAAVIVLVLGFVGLGMWRETRDRVVAGPGVDRTAPVVAEGAYEVMHLSVLGETSNGGLRVTVAGEGVLLEGMPVVASEGLVGVVVSVGPEESEVALLTSPAFEIPALVVVADDASSVQNSDPYVTATLRGNGAGQPLTVEVSGTAAGLDEVVIGDAVVADHDASGLAQMKVPIGTIASAPVTGGQGNAIFEVAPALDQNLISGRSDLTVLIRSPLTPATALRPPEGYLRSMNTARETAIQRCMTEQGFDYRPSPNLEDIPSDGSDFVEFDEWDAWRTDQLTETPGFGLALFGVDGDGPDSCTGSANDTIFGAVSAEALATQLQADRYEQARMVARRDDSLTQLRTDLATCANQAGYPTGSGADEVFEAIDAAVLAGFEPVNQCDTYPDLLTRLDPLIETQLQAWDKQNPNRYRDVEAEWDEDMSRFQDIIEQTATAGPEGES